MRVIVISTFTCGQTISRIVFVGKCDELPCAFTGDVTLQCNRISKAQYSYYLTLSSQVKFLCQVTWNSTRIERKIFLEKLCWPLVRYGIPDMPFLGTLKNKFQISWFLTINMVNLILFFWSGFPLCLKFAEFSWIWQPWKSKFVF